MSTELKPCPFCGSSDVRIDKETVGPFGELFYCALFCNDCNSVAAYGVFHDEVKAIEAWNRRVHNDTTQRTT